MKKLLLCALLIMLMCVGTVFAGGGRDRGKDDRPRVAVSLGPTANAWHARLREVIDAAVAHHPDINWTINNAQNAQHQIEVLTVFRGEGYDAMLIMPTDGNLLAPIASAIYKDGTPTIILNRAIASQDFTAFVEGGNYGGGVNAARYLGQKLGGTGNIAVLRSNAGTPIDVDRYNGFSGTLAREFPNIRILVEGEGRFERAAGLEAMTNILPGYPRIDALYTQDDEAALGALVAIENAGRRDIRFITGFGGTKPTYEKFLANDPVYVASMSYFPDMGFDGIEMVVRVLRGIPVPKVTTIASDVVTAENVRDFMDRAY
jgi:ribose transport system substrate-binding protein